MVYIGEIMQSKKAILKMLSTSLTKKRFIHSINVMKTAVNLATFYGGDVKRAELAGLLHDCAKDFPTISQLKMIKDFGIILDEIEENEPALIHGPLGAAVAEKVYNIDDKAVLRAIKFHTTGNENMTLLDKIIFISDIIEPTRQFSGVEVLRKEAYNDLDLAIIHACDSIIKFVIEQKKLLHPRTLNTRNNLILNKKTKSI